VHLVDPYTYCWMMHGAYNVEVILYCEIRTRHINTLRGIVQSFLILEHAVNYVSTVLSTADDLKTCKLIKFCESSMRYKGLYRNNAIICRFDLVPFKSVLCTAAFDSDRWSNKFLYSPFLAPSDDFGEFLLDIREETGLIMFRSHRYDWHRHGIVWDCIKLSFFYLLSYFHNWLSEYIIRSVPFFF
jgi:hypothetical protein